MIRDRRCLSPPQLLLRRANVDDQGLRVALRVPDLALCDGFLRIDFDLLDPDAQELGSATWRHRNSDYTYHVTLGRSWHFDDPGKLERVWTGIQSLLHCRVGILHGSLSPGSCCFYLERSCRDLNRLFFGNATEWLHNESDRYCRTDRKWVAMHASL